MKITKAQADRLGDPPCKMIKTAGRELQQKLVGYAVRHLTKADSVPAEEEELREMIQLSFRNYIMNGR